MSAKKKVSKRPKVSKNPKTGFGFALPTRPEEIDASVVLTETEDSLLLDKWGLQSTPTHETIFPPSLRAIKSIDRTQFPIRLEDQKFGQPATPDLLRKYVNKPHLSSFNTSTLDCYFLNLEPAILYFPSFLPPATCRDYISLITSKAVSTKSPTFGDPIDNPSIVRTSVTFYTENDNVPELNSKAVDMLCGSESEASRFEDIQMLRYPPGGEFSYHIDNVPSPSTSNGGDRTSTLLVYLNDVVKGGRTIFRDLDLQLRPIEGSAVLFFNKVEGGVDDRMVHRGEPVEKGEKFCCQIWNHERSYESQL
ncbi:hypothetical protein TL16_g10830 [Triparma laevis f. inornata]|uniref:Fe2OG dioxygenase domain-containing protein n=1 Tax=Triparma laevis f. inornata TaxID=1714386 RepID=A0A9W7BIL9_9STRA|nr:hypothetical protein TL16_g10830 [Triparma laevis f. inornata]